MAIAKVYLGDVGEWAAAVVGVVASGVALWIALWSHRKEVGAASQRRKEDVADAERRDLLETRKLLVIVLMFDGNSRAIGNDLLGSVANAVARHRDLMPLATAVGVLRQWELHRDKASRDEINNLIVSVDARLTGLAAGHAPW